jgi:hypothetical protein
MKVGLRDHLAVCVCVCSCVYLPIQLLNALTDLYETWCLDHAT